MNFKKIPQSTVICAIVAMLAIAALVWTVYRCDESGKGNATEVRNDLPDLRIKKVDRIGAGQWRVLVENVGYTCSGKGTPLVVTPFYTDGKGQIRPEKSEGASVDLLCPNNQTVRILSFPPGFSENDEEGHVIQYQIHHVDAEVNPLPGTFEEVQRENNKLTQMVQ